MIYNTRSPTLAEVFEIFRESSKRQMRCALIGQVQSYDASTQRATVQPLVNDFLQQPDGSFADMPFPALPNVPVQFPCGGNIRMTFPVQAGDTGLLIVTDLSLDLWKQQGNQVSPNTDQRRHHISDAVFVPGVVPNPKAWSSADASAFTLGPDAGPQIVVRANSIELGGSAGSPPTDAVLKGTTYRAAEDTLFAGVSTTFTTAAASCATAGAALSAAGSIPAWAGAAQAAVAAAGVAVTAAGTAMAAFSAFLTTFESTAATYLSTINKVG
jgi:hypothetical protein